VVSFDKQDPIFYDDSVSNNRPVLHRKDLFVTKDCPGRNKFEKLTKNEGEISLLNHNYFGNRNNWDSLLKKKGYLIKGHRLFKRVLRKYRESI